MKKLVALCGFLIAASAGANTPPPPLPWFHSALVSFLKEPRVLVLGWSQDGKAAVLSPEDSGGRGGTGLDLQVIDTVEDSLVKAVGLWSDEFEEDIENQEALAEAMEFSADGQAFLDAFEAAGIRPSDSALEVSSFPLKTPKSQYTAGTLVLPVGESYEDEGYYGRTLDWRLVVRSSQGEKTIAKGREEQAIDVLVKGYVTSPFEPRILVVYGITHPGFEGEQPLTYHFSGCLLTKGFTAK